MNPEKSWYGSGQPTIAHRQQIWKQLGECGSSQRISNLWLHVFLCTNLRAKMFSNIENCRIQEDVPAPRSGCMFWLDPASILRWNLVTDSISALHEQEGQVNGLEGLLRSPASSLPWKIRRDRPQKVALSILIYSWVLQICSSEVLVSPNTLTQTVLCNQLHVAWSVPHL